MAITRRQATALANTLGASIEYVLDREGFSHEVTVDAPDGYVWRDSGVHQLVCAGDSVDRTPMSELISYAVERMNLGVEKCGDAHCDVCSEEGM